MRTTLNFDDRLIRAAKSRAAQDGETLTRLVERALREYLDGPRVPSKPFRLELLIKEGTRTMPGVNLDDRDSLYELMEGRG